MIELIIYSIILIIIAIISGISEAIMDTVAEKYHQSIFTKFNNPKYWDKQQSYKNKYVEGSKLKKKLFATFLVFTTDAWHLFKSIHTFTLFVIVCIIYLISCSIWIFICILLSLYLIKKLVFEYSLYKFIKK